MAPEIVMNQGHGLAVDLWAFGVLIYEMLTGRTPFAKQDAMETYNLIILGIENVRMHDSLSDSARDLIMALW